MSRRRAGRKRPLARTTTAPPRGVGGELIGDLHGPLAVVGPDGTLARLPLVVGRNSFQTDSAVGPEGCVSALSLLQPQVFVDPSDAAGPFDQGWRIVWAVGAEDRWHIASRETAVRSRLVEDVPVTETAMRIPGGDIVQRVCAVYDGSSRGVLLEFENESSVPVSLALAVVENDAWRGSTDVSRSRRQHGSTLVEVRGSRLMVDGQVALDLGRVPGGTVAVADGGVWTAVGAGPDSGDRVVQSRLGGAAAAAVVPLVPGSPIRALVPIHGVLDRRTIHGEAASGWQAVVAQAANVSLPDETAMRAWRRGIAVSILVAGCGGVLSRSGLVNPCTQRPDSHNGMIAPAVRMARTAVVLDRVCLPDEADRARERLLAAADVSLLSGEEANAALQALASRRLRSGRTSALAEMAGSLAFEADDFLQPHTLAQVAAALDAEVPAAARDARRMLSDLEERLHRESRRSVDASIVERALHEDSRSAFTGSASRSARPDLAVILRRSVEFGGDGLPGLEALLDCLVAEAADHLVIAPFIPAEWIGAPVDTRGLVTSHGQLSFSVRWHGTRAALLWELVPPTQRPWSPVTLRCGLDASWTTSEPSGEALLGPD